MGDLGVWGYLREYSSEREDLLDAVDQVFGSGQLILGDSCRRFEEDFAEWVGTEGCVGVDNGTNALVLALVALGVGPGDEVITVANTAAPTIVAIDQIGAIPVFVDVVANTGLMSVEDIDGKVSSRTRCILVVHLYGQPVNMSAVTEVAHRQGLAVVEDCAQAHGASIGGQMVGSFGDAAAFSFYPTKVLGAYGDAGAVVGSSEIVAKVRTHRYYGMKDKYCVDVTPGFNARMDEVQAEILRRKLSRVDGYIARRRQIAQLYRDGLEGIDIQPLQWPPGSVPYLYVVQHPQRDALVATMRDQSIRVNVSYQWPAHLMPGFAKLGGARGDLPVTEAFCDRVLSLPMYPTLTDEEVAQVVDVLSGCLTRL